MSTDFDFLDEAKPVTQETLDATLQEVADLEAQLKALKKKKFFMASILRLRAEEHSACWEEMEPVRQPQSGLSWMCSMQIPARFCLMGRNLFRTEARWDICRRKEVCTQKR